MLRSHRPTSPSKTVNRKISHDSTAVAATNPPCQNDHQRNPNTPCLRTPQVDPKFTLNCGGSQGKHCKSSLKKHTRTIPDHRETNKGVPPDTLFQSGLLWTRGAAGEEQKCLFLRGQSSNHQRPPPQPTSPPTHPPTTTTSPSNSNTNDARRIPQLRVGVNPSDLLEALQELRTQSVRRRVNEHLQNLWVVHRLLEGAPADCHVASQAVLVLNERQSSPTMRGQTTRSRRGPKKKTPCLKLCVQTGQTRLTERTGVCS